MPASLPQSTMPNRDKIEALTLADEGQLVERLIQRARFNEEDGKRVDVIARRLVQAARAGRQQHGGVDAS